ncbi:CHASE2 domain-containing protein [Kamptonema sp. UHCC 0994]|uniref:CHASE2 domain-containing protein n=1 Tax=Kamptonema sp. UHCC 0994 TaxID=3031329 RepID=UPI0023B99344|nr:CHASE2 domain-containing protein [Kamptonema sp. UHCC 0994]MDF0552580.1 CHASE2 domain-containing protein [Kamptonema sp. UHCC 0994]
MSKFVILEIGNANSEQRYPVNLRIGDSINSTIIQSRGWFPPVTTFLEAYNNLQEARIKYGFGSSRTLEELEELEELEPNTRALEHIPKKGRITKISVQESANSVKNAVDNWLDDGDSLFRPVRDKLLQVLSAESGNVRLMIQTDDVSLWGFPWHLWHILDDLKVEPIFSRLTNTKFDYQPINSKTKVRILVILGDSTKIDVEADLLLLKESIAYDNAEIETLVATSSSKLNDQLWDRNWDIIFFAGHSSSNPDYSQGKLAISETETITIADLKYGLANAIKHGLKLVIFNSCDGMGLVNELASLQIPAVIAMRERVPDQVAQKFLEYFLEAFAKENKCLRDSVRKARERLHGMEGEYPCASWLPMIYEDPSVEPPTWIELLKGNEEERQRVSIWPSLRAVLMISLLVTGVVMGLRWVGLLENVEKKAFDQLTEIMPDKGLDSRLLIVKVTPDDFKQLNNEYPLQDKTIVRALEKLNKYKPRTIGLDIFRDVPVGQGRAELIKYLQEHEHIIPICMFPSEEIPEGIASLPDIPDIRLGFGDIVEDSDRTIRRHLLAMKPYPSSHCKTVYSLGLNLALNYFNKTPNTLLNGVPKFSIGFAKDYWKIGNTYFKKLEKNQGFYQKQQMGGFQIILNYRSRKDLFNIAEKVTLMEILNEQVNPSDIRDKIVLIGVTDTTRGSRNYNTPYNKEIPDLIFLAHRVSQILTAVEDNIPLMWFLPQWGDILLILTWSMVGSFCTICFQSRLHLGLAQVVLLSILYGVCLLFLLTVGCILPLVPSGFALLGASGCLIVYNASSKNK